jgi:hypothetical protein
MDWHRAPKQPIVNTTNSAKPLANYLAKDIQLLAFVPQES